MFLRTHAQRNFIAYISGRGKNSKHQSDIQTSQAWFLIPSYSRKLLSCELEGCFWWSINRHTGNGNRRLIVSNVERIWKQIYVQVFWGVREIYTPPCHRLPNRDRLSCVETGVAQFTRIHPSHLPPLNVTVHLSLLGVIARYWLGLSISFTPNLARAGHAKCIILWIQYQKWK
jgi:hypothetical protein